MIKTTLSKIKKACTIAFIPRILRGDFRYVPGKFEKLSFGVLRKAGNSTESGTTHQEEECKKCKRLIELAFGPCKPDIHNHGIENTATPNLGIHNKQKVPKENIVQIMATRVNAKNETEQEKCDRIIAEIFGKEDDRHKKDLLENVQEIPMEDIHIQTTTTKKEVAKETPIVQAEQLNAAGIDPSNREDEKKCIDSIKPTSIKHLRVQTMAHEQDNIAANLENIKQTHTKNSGYNWNQIDSMSVAPKKNSKVQATTAKENEEKLVQKIEIIYETPHVEAAPPKVEGFNAPPKALGDRKAILNCADDNKPGASESDVQVTLDEIAKRCLDSPCSQIDHRLLKEMEKLGIPHAGQNSSTENSLTEDKLVQMDVLKKPRKPVKKTEIDLETREFEKDPIDCSDRERLNPSFQLPPHTDRRLIDSDIDTPILKSQETKDTDLSKNQILLNVNTSATHEPVGSRESDHCHCYEENDDCINSRPKLQPNQVLIDPYDKKTLASDTEEFDFDNTVLSDLKLLESEQVWSPDYSRDKQKSHVTLFLASSEACPISANECIEPTMCNEISNCEQSKPIYGSNYFVPTEINWKPFPSFEAREEVIDLRQPDSAEHSQPIQLLTTINPSYMQYQDTEEAHDLKEYVASELTHISSDEKEQSYNFIKSNTESIQTPLESTQAEKPNDRAYSEEHGPHSFMQQEATVDTQMLELESNNTQSNTASKAKEQISHSFIQPESMVNPLQKRVFDTPDRNITSNLTTAVPLPTINPEKNISLSELLKRVRERNRLEYCREVALKNFKLCATEIDPIEGKCGKKPPPCPPPAPKCPPPSPCPRPPPPCPPPPPPCPKPCKPACPPPCPPPKKNPCDKFMKTCSRTSIRDTLTLVLQLGSRLHTPQESFVPIIAFKLKDVETSCINRKAVLTDEVVVRLQSLGTALSARNHRTSETDGHQNIDDLAFARDFDPWTPIPSWPIPRKEKKRPLVCPKEGCKVVPPPRLNEPCGKNPCLGFPKRSNFSITDLISMRRKKVYDIGEF